MWDLPRPGLEPVSPALAGRFSTTTPPGKPEIFLMCSFITVSFPLTTAFAVSHKLWYFVFPFLFVSRYFLISLLSSSLTIWLFRIVLFNFYILVTFPVFLLLLISSFILLCLEKTLEMISVFFNFKGIFNFFSPFFQFLCILHKYMCYTYFKDLYFVHDHSGLFSLLGELPLLALMILLALKSTNLMLIKPLKISFD